MSNITDIYEGLTFLSNDLVGRIETPSSHGVVGLKLYFHSATVGRNIEFS